jgi:hypothetical protein
MDRAVPLYRKVVLAEMMVVLLAAAAWAVLRAPPRWTIVSGQSYCSVSSDGMCITDGIGSYGVNEACTVRAEMSMTITTTEFETEGGVDLITVGDTAYSGSSGPMNVQVAAGTLVTWASDYDTNRAGFTICAMVSAPPPFSDLAERRGPKNEL